jgi:hypothetical protein
LKRNGSFATAHPWRIKVFRLLGKSQTLKYLNLSWPLWIRPADARLTARIIKEAETVFHRKWPNSPFYVLLYPDEFSLGLVHYIKPYLDEYDIKYIECPDVFEGRVPLELRAVYGRHPSAIANEVLAEKIVGMLGL